MFVTDEKVYKEFLDTHISQLEDFGLPVIVMNILERAGYLFVRDVAKLGASDLINISNISYKQQHKLQRALKLKYEALMRAHRNIGELVTVQAFPVQWRYTCTCCEELQLRLDGDIGNGMIDKCRKCGTTQRLSLGLRDGS